MKACQHQISGVQNVDNLNASFKFTFRGSTADLIIWVGLCFHGTKRVHDLPYCFWCIQQTNALSQMHNAMPLPMSWLSVLAHSALHRFHFLLTPPHPWWKEAASTRRVAVRWDKIMAESVEQDLYPQVCKTSDLQNLQVEHHHFSCQQHFTHTGRRKESPSPDSSYIIRKNWGELAEAKYLALRQC